MRGPAVLLILVVAMVAACSFNMVLYSHAATGIFEGAWFDEPESSVAIDYEGSGSCLGLGFSLLQDPDFTGLDTPKVVSTPTVTTSAPSVSGTWVVTLDPSRYRIRGGGPGCAWSLTVRGLAPNEPGFHFE
jgi:hypothetical protein